MSSPKNELELAGVPAYAALFLAALLTKIIPALADNLSPDACGYLDIMRNIVEGRGAVISYNIYQVWHGTVYYPALPYMQSVFSLVAWPVYAVFRTVESLNVLNAVVAGVNTAVLYALLKRLYRPCTAFWGALLAGISLPMQLTAVYAWTEQFGLLLTLGSIAAIPRRPVFAGALMGLAFLVRSSSLYSAAGLLAAFTVVRQPVRGLLRDCGLFIAGFCAAVIPYQAVCLLWHGRAYPEYLAFAAAFRISELFPGAAFHASYPALTVPALDTAAKLSAFLRNVPHHLLMFGRELGILAFFIVPVGWRVWRERNVQEAAALGVALANVMLFSLSLYWLPDIEIRRYALLPVVLLTPLVVAAAHGDRGLFGAGTAQGAQSRPWFFYYIAAILLTVNLSVVFRQNAYYLNPRNAYESALERRGEDLVAQWLSRETTPGGLVATNCLTRAFRLGRPVVALPSGVAMTDRNLDDFLHIYQPVCVVLCNRSAATPLLERGYYQALDAGRLAIYVSGLD